MCAGGEDKELEGIISRIARRIISKRGGRAGAGEPGVKPVYKTRAVDTKSPHGIYVYDKGERQWVLVRRDGEPFKPWKDGYWIIYFDNTRCPACRIYDFSWYVFVETLGRTMEDTEFVIILCEWFARECESEAASRSFREYGIVASPTTVLMKVSGSRVEKMEKVRGAKSLEELIGVVNRFRG